jgi:hypothetical protein
VAREFPDRHSDLSEVLARSAIWEPPLVKTLSYNQADRGFRQLAPSSSRSLSTDRLGHPDPGPGFHLIGMVKLVKSAVDLDLARQAVDQLSSRPLRDDGHIPLLPGSR